MPGLSQVQAPQVSQTIWQFIVDNFLFGDVPEEFSEDDSLLGKGVVDSTGILELIQYLEATFGIEVAEDETTPENLDSVARAAAFVQRKLVGHS